MANAHLEDANDANIPSLTVQTLDDATYSGWTVEKLLDRVPPNYPHTYVFVFDATSASDADHALIVVDLFHQPGRTFRTLPSEVQMIDSNLSIANCDWEDFADHVDDDGVYRGKFE